MFSFCLDLQGCQLVAPMYLNTSKGLNSHLWVPGWVLGVTQFRAEWTMPLLKLTAHKQSILAFKTC